MRLKLWLKLILVTLALLLSLVLRVSASHEKHQNQSHTHNHEAPDPSAKPTPAITVVVQPAPVKIIQYGAAVEENNSRKKWYERPTITDWGLFVITLLYTGISLGLLHLARRQAELTKETLIADRRAFVAAVNIKPFFDAAPLGGPYNWRIRPIWRNSGATPTDRMTLYVQCEIRDSPLPNGYVFTNLIEPGTGLLPPQSDMFGGAAPVGQPITPEDLLEVQRNRRFIYLWGWAKYFDVFPGTPEHMTHFCWLITIVGDPLKFDPSAAGTPPTRGALTFGYLNHSEGNYTKDET